MHSRVDLGEKVTRQEHIGESSRSATLGAEEYVVSTSIVLEPKRLQTMRARIRCVLDCYSKKPFQTVNNPVKMKHKKQYVLVEELVKTEEADKMDGRRQAMEKSKAKTMTWMVLRNNESNVDKEGQDSKSSAKGNTYAKQVAYLGPRAK
jgi:hypothetical protein